jgi:acyl-CoA thioesterase FadM
MNKVKINFNQKIYRNSDLLVEAEVLVISVNKLGKITKILNEIYLHLVSLKN